MKTFKFCAVVLLCALSAVASKKPKASNDIFHSGDPFNLKILEVRSLGADQKVGFSHVPHVYAVEAENGTTHYTLYCVNYSPEPGKTYQASEDFVSSDFSFLKLWPVDRNDASLGLPSKGPRLFRVVTFFNALTGKQPRLACDIYKEKPTS
jgi:hypothetical protein